MGSYDEFVDKKCNVQLKVGFNELRVYKVGDVVDPIIPDGIYMGYEGFVVVAQGLVAMVSPVIYDKWGGEISVEEFHSLLNGSNPISSALSTYEENLKKSWPGSKKKKKSNSKGNNL